MSTRRDFLRTGSAAVLASALPRSVRRNPSILTSLLGGPAADRADPDLVRSLALAAVDAARTAGATYADARLFRQVGQGIGALPDLAKGASITDNESLGIGVRALVDGQWGFAASPYWDAAEAATLARTAVAQAKAYAAIAEKRVVDMGPAAVASGSWQHPGIIDPFTISLEEKLDLLQAIANTASQMALPDYDVRLLTAGFGRQERAVATSDGSYFTQTFFVSDPVFTVWYTDPLSPRAAPRGDYVAFDGLAKEQRGWERFQEAHLTKQVRAPATLAEVRDRVRLPHKPVDVGRYDVVFSAEAMADLVEKTLGRVTEIDRAMGLEANSGGTTFLSDPLAMLGSYQMASPLVTLTANRSMPHGLATTRWDDEGVVPDNFTLVDRGILSDFQSTREQASWLAPGYARLGRPVRSHGCARSTGALSLIMQGPPNLALEPGTAPLTFADLVAGTRKGIAVLSCFVRTDYQLRTGIGNQCVMREIVNGKLGSFIDGGTFLFNTMELWKNVVALGGPASADMFPSARAKGDPTNDWEHSVRAVPVRVRDVTIIERTRKA